MLAADLLLGHGEGTLVAHGVDAFGEAGEGGVPSVEGDGGKAIVAVADNGCFGELGRGVALYGLGLLEGEGVVAQTDGGGAGY